MKGCTCQILLFLMLCTASYITGDDFEYMYKTNPDQHLNYPISFDNPLPTWLKGTLIRNSAGRFEMGQRFYTNAVDAYAKLLSVKFPGNGTAFFSTKFVESKSFKESNASNDIVPFPTYGTVQPPYTASERLKALTTPMDTYNVNVANFSNVFGAITDDWTFYQFDPLTLDTMEFKQPPVPDFHGSGNPPGVQSMMSSAHPLPVVGDPRSQFTFLVGQSILPGINTRINLIHMKPDGSREAIAMFEVEKAFYMHSFAVTENYVIFFAAPYYVNVYAMLLSGRMADGLQWNSHDNTQIYVVNIKTGKTTQMPTDNMFILHHINAFETKENLILLDAPVLPDPHFFLSFEIASLRNLTKRKTMKEGAKLNRFTIDLENKKATRYAFPPNSKAPCAVRLETPTINENYRSGNYCIIYGMVFNWDSEDMSHMALVKKDVCNGENDKMIYIPNHFPSEALYVSPPAGVTKEEDDGVLLSVFLDGDKKRSYIALIDAKSFTIISKAYLPVWVSVTAHGKFFNDLY